VQGNQAEKFEIVHMYIENFEAKIDIAIRRFSLILEKRRREIRRCQE